MPHTTFQLLAVDGNTDGSPASTALTVTQPQAFWVADLGRVGA